ncbi:MAG: hypothetical protein IPM54_34935 [Polyangiaceae bacterium]|nr:hypothetical protein [Polyangiaceae bacterium]
MRISAGFCCVLALGCGSSVDDAANKPIEGELTSSTYIVDFPALTIAPGTERTQCIVKRLGNDELIRVHQIHNSLPAGSHHLIIYRTADTEEKLDPYDCTPFLDSLDPSKGSTIMVTQKHEETLTLPKGVAFSMPAGQMVRLEMHYINTTSAPLEVSAKSTFVTIPAKDYEHEADFLFIGNPDINIAPHSKNTLGPTFFNIPDDLLGVNFFGITGHTHQYGTNVTVAAAETKDGPDKSVYDVPGWLWSEPETVMHDPPFAIPQGGGFRFTCEYNNTSDQQVGFGESANDEMCFFWAYYYPSQGSYVCVHTKQIAGGYDLCCPGNSLCGFLNN